MERNYLDHDYGVLCLHLGAIFNHHLCHLSREWGGEHQTIISTRLFDLETFSEHIESWRNRSLGTFSNFYQDSTEDISSFRYRISGLVRYAHRSRQLSRLLLRLVSRPRNDEGYQGAHKLHPGYRLHGSSQHK